MTSAITGNVAEAGNANLTFNAATGNLSTTLLSVTGNANVGNLGTGGLIVATGNITGGNLVTGGALSVTGNATVGNIISSGTGGNISGANVISANTFTATANITAGNLIGPHANGNSNINIPTANGNVNISAVGNANIFVVTGTGANVTGNLNATGNLIAGTDLFVGSGATGTSFTNPIGIFKDTGVTYVQVAVVNSTGTGSADITTYGNNGDDTQSWTDMGFTGNTFNDANYTVTAAGDGYLFVQGNTSFGGNLVIATGATGTTKDIVFATGGFLAGNIKARLFNANGTFNVTGNVNGGNLTTAGALSVTGNATVGNLTAGGGSGGNISGANVISANTFTATANVTGANIVASTYTITGVNAAVSAAGTVQANATVIAKEINVVSTVAAGAGVVLPTAIAGMRITILNTSANALAVYPAVNGIINAQAANAAYSAPAGAKLDFVSTTTTQWYTLNATYN
jgi:hypothetical protein